jgi:hypothetical protein
MLFLLPASVMPTIRRFLSEQTSLVTAGHMGIGSGFDPFILFGLLVAVEVV